MDGIELLVVVTQATCYHNLITLPNGSRMRVPRPRRTFIFKLKKNKYASRILQTNSAADRDTASSGLVSRKSNDYYRVIKTAYFCIGMGLSPWNLMAKTEIDSLVFESDEPLSKYS